MKTAPTKIRSRYQESKILMRHHGLRFFLKEVGRYSFWRMVSPLKLNYFIVPRVNKNIKRQLAGKKSIPSIVDFAYSFNWFGLTIAPGQVKEEITELLNILRNELKPDRLMELGTNNGGTLFLLCQAASDNSSLISLDLPGGKFGGGYPDWKKKLFVTFARKSQSLHLIGGNSHDNTTLKRILVLLGNDKLDFLLIDGDHTIEGVEQDYSMYGQLVRKGGIIAFHDIVKNTVTEGCNVTDFWNEVKRGHRFVEIIKDPNQGWGGIGVLYV